MHNQVNRCLSVKTCASKAYSILMLCPILSCAAIVHTILQCPCARLKISYLRTFLKRVKKESIEGSCDIISTRKGKRGWNFDKSPLSSHPSINPKRKHCRCLSLGCTRRNHTARGKGGTWVQSGNTRLRILD